MSPTQKVPVPDQFATSLLRRKLTLCGDTAQQDIPLAPLSMLVLESMRRCLTKPSAFGKTSQSLDETLAPVFGLVFKNPASKARAKEVLKAYDALPQTGTATLAGQPVKTFLAAQPVSLPLQGLVEQFYGSDTLHVKEYLALEEKSIPGPTFKLHRRVAACMDEIECKDPEEQQIDLNLLTAAAFEAGSGDEIYFITSGALYSRIIYDSSFEVSPVTEHVGTKSGHKKKVLIPGNMKFPVYYDLNEHTFDPKGLPAINLSYSFSLYERENSEEERRQAMAGAVRHAMSVLQSLIQWDPLGLVISIGQMTYDLVIALDGDDLLGHRDFRFGNLAAFKPGSRDTTVTVSDTHLLNDYKYIVRSHFELTDLPE